MVSSQRWELAAHQDPEAARARALRHKKHGGRKKSSKSLSRHKSHKRSKRSLNKRKSHKRSKKSRRRSRH